MSEAQKIKDLPPVTPQNRADLLKKAIDLAKKDGKFGSDDLQALNDKFGENSIDLKTALTQAQAELVLSAQLKLEAEKKRNDKIKWFRDKFPQFNGLLDGGMEFEEVEARAKLYASVEKSSSWLFDSSWTKEARPKVLEALATKEDPDFFTSNTIKASFGLFDDGIFGSSSSEMTYLEFISKATNETSLVVELFGDVGNLKEMTPAQAEQAERLYAFMNSFEKINTDSKYKSKIISMHKKLLSGDLPGAIADVEVFLHKDFNLSVRGIISSDETLFNGLRDIGDTENSGTLGAGLLSNDIKQSTAQDINTSVEKLKPTFREKSEKKYEDILKSLEGHPLWYDFANNKEASIEEIQNVFALKGAIDGYIKENGSEKLGLLGNIYDDMRGLNGWDNFTDENAKITKEAGIIAASFVLTAGAGIILSGIGAAARGAQLASIAARGARGAGLINRGRNVLSTARIGVLGGVARTYETVNGLTGFSAGAVKLLGSTLLFTTSEWSLRLAYNVPGERQESIASFGERFAKNFAMFGVFAGAGKITEGLISKYPQIFGLNFATKFGTLVSGDISAMYFLHCIETGEIVPSAEEWAIIAAQAAGFRVLMKGIEAVYPKVAQKIRDVRENRRNGSNPTNSAETTTTSLPEGIKIEGGVRKSTGVADNATLGRNGLLSDEARIAEAENLLGTSLNDIQKAALLKAHGIEQGRNVVKGRILMKEGKFTREQTQILMDRGIAGTGFFHDMAKIEDLTGKVKDQISKVEKGGVGEINLEGGVKIKIKKAESGEVSLSGYDKDGNIIGQPSAPAFIEGTTFMSASDVDNYVTNWVRQTLVESKYYLKPLSEILPSLAFRGGLPNFEALKIIKILSSKGTLTLEEMNILLDRRNLLKSEAYRKGLTEQQLSVVDKEITLIEKRIAIEPGKNLVLVEPKPSVEPSQGAGAGSLPQMGPKLPIRESLANINSAEVKKILNTKGKLTPEQIEILGKRRDMLNNDAYRKGLTEQQLSVVNREVRLIEARIRQGIANTPIFDTPQQAKTWLEKNGGKLLLGPGIVIMIGGILYAASKKKDGQIDLIALDRLRAQSILSAIGGAAAAGAPPSNPPSNPPVPPNNSPGSGGNAPVNPPAAGAGAPPSNPPSNPPVPPNNSPGSGGSAPVNPPSAGAGAPPSNPPSNPPVPPNNSPGVAGGSAPANPSASALGTKAPSQQLSPEQIKLAEAKAYNKKYSPEEIKLIQIIIGLTGDDVDGKAGNKTIGKIIEFQKANGLNPDGKLGSKTLGKMIGKSNQDYVIIQGDKDGEGKIVKKLKVQGETATGAPTSLSPNGANTEVKKPTINSLKYTELEKGNAQVYLVTTKSGEKFYAVIGKAESSTELRKIAEKFVKERGIKVRVDASMGSYFVTTKKTDFGNEPGNDINDLNDYFKKDGFVPGYWNNQITDANIYTREGTIIEKA